MREIPLGRARCIFPEAQDPEQAGTKRNSGMSLGFVRRWITRRSNSVGSYGPDLPGLCKSDVIQ